MEHTQQDRTLALAGIYQAAKLVQEIARNGSVADANLSALLETLFRFDANSVLEVYGDSSTVKKVRSHLRINYPASVSRAIWN